MIKIRVKFNGGIELIKTTTMTIRQAKSFYYSKLFFGGKSAYSVEVF